MINPGSPSRPACPADGALVTPSDSTTFQPSHIRVGGAGDVKVTTEAGSTFVYPSAVAGEILPFTVVKVWFTDTTATLIVRAF